MSRIKVTRQHRYSSGEAQEALKNVASQLENKLGLDLQWEDDNKVAFDHSLAKGQCCVTDDTIDIDVKLGIMARPLKGKIEKRINSELDKIC